jgi:hypothetical protein
MLQANPTASAFLLERNPAMNNTYKRTFGQRINAWLTEPKGEVFRQGKWRFWYPALVGLTALNAVMTAVIFGADGMQKYIGSIVVLAGAVLCWLALGLLHYSDSDDRLLAIGTAALDSITLLFVATHFAFLLWCQGHLWTLRAAEAQYRTDIATYNAQWKPVTDSNERIAATVERIASVEKETERLRNDTAYWSRRNKVEPSKSGIKFDAKLSAVEVPPPPKAPTEASAEFLAGWDWWIRVAGFGELALSIITLIFVRGRTAWLNARRAPGVEEFPDEVDAGEVEKRAPAKRGKLSPKKEPAKNHGSFNSEGLKRLREALRDISFRLAGFSFKSNVKDDCVWIFLMKARAGTQEAVASAKAKLSILDDAMTMAPADFRERLEKFLRQSGFEI